MAIYVNKNNGFEQTEPVTRVCPHCGTHAQLLPVANPSFEVLAQTRPKHAGLLFRCAACNEPRFLRAPCERSLRSSIELAPNLVEVERVRERFQYGYLPDTVEQLLRETLDCYSLGAHNAFATMCRRTTRTALRALGATVQAALARYAARGATGLRSRRRHRAAPSTPCCSPTTAIRR